MKPDPPLELRKPVTVAFVRRVVIQDDVDLLALRLVSQDVIKESCESPPAFWFP